MAPDITDRTLEATLGLVMVALGCAIAVMGGWRWRRTDRALREGGPMPGSSHLLVVVAAIVVIAVAIALTIVIGH